MTNPNTTGIELEKKVESWARNRFKASHSETRYQVNGLSVSRPYEVDVWIQIPRRIMVLFRSSIDIWIECKDRKTSIKRKDISDLVSKAKDVYQATIRGKQDFYFDTLMIVSTSRYDFDAIALANQEGVACVLYDGKSYLLKNNWNWDDEPKWLRDVKAA